MQVQNLITGSHSAPVRPVQGAIGTCHDYNKQMNNSGERYSYACRYALGCHGL